MSNSHKLRNILITAGLSCSAIAAYNYMTSRKADQAKYLNNHILSSQFNWKLGNIYYTKQGKGSPVLLIHNYLSMAGSWEWKSLAERLETNHTVYTIDLPGCGRSDKSFSAYTNYLYVQLLADFIGKIIGEPVILVTSGHSIDPILMLAKNEPSLFTHIFAVNPPAQRKASICDTLIGKLIQLPLLGTFAYNIMMGHSSLEKYFEQKYLFYDSDLLAAYEKAYWQGAHMNQMHGKYLLSSYLLGYMNSNLSLSLKGMSVPLTILSGNDVTDSENAILFYQKNNPQITIRQIENGRLMMHMEKADEIASCINSLI